jgi:FdhD protein
METTPGALRTVLHDGREDTIAVEEPLEIRVDDEPLAVTMRTPGHDEELALGFLYGEGLIDGPRRAGLTDDLANNTIVVAGPLTRAPDKRNFYTTSSCGVCGKGAIDEVSVHSERLPVWPHEPLARSLLADLPNRLVQPGFERTGGLHATGLFDASGSLLCVREDVGRHNAMDKVIGWALARGMLPLAENLLCVSGRLSFELVQKAAVGGAPVLVGVGAPTSLAVELARDRNLTLCGFARGGQMNVYSGEHRLKHFKEC